LSQVLTPYVHFSGSAQTGMRASAVSFHQWRRHLSSYKCSRRRDSVGMSDRAAAQMRRQRRTFAAGLPVPARFRRWGVGSREYRSVHREQ